jgi:recombination protein RecA
MESHAIQNGPHGVLPHAKVQIAAARVFSVKILKAAQIGVVRRGEVRRSSNQLRQKMNAMAFSDPWTTSGGKALAFHASTRLRLALTGKITNSAGDVIGVKVKATVVKNRLGPPHRVAEFEIYFNRGIDDTGAWLKMMKELKMVKQGGAWYTYEDATKGELKFQSKDFAAFLEEDPARKELIYQQICDSLVMKYQSEFDPEDVNISAASDDE